MSLRHSYIKNKVILKNKLAKKNKKQVGDERGLENNLGK